jgi:hypothetical protein
MVVLWLRQYYSEHRPYSLVLIPEGASSPSGRIATVPIATDSSIFALIAALLIVQTFP